MNSLITFGRQFLPFAVLLAVGLYIVVLMAVTIFRFGLNGVSLKNIREVIISRTMLIFLCIYVILMFLFAVDRTFFLAELHERIELQKRQYDEWMRQHDEWKREMERQKEKEVEKEKQKKGKKGDNEPEKDRRNEERNGQEKDQEKVAEGREKVKSREKGSVEKRGRDS